MSTILPRTSKAHSHSTGSSDGFDLHKCPLRQVLFSPRLWMRTLEGEGGCAGEEWFIKTPWLVQLSGVERS